MYVRQDGVRFNWELLLEAIAGTGRLRRADEPSGTRGNCNSPKRGEYSCRQSPSEQLEQPAARSPQPANPHSPPNCDGRRGLVDFPMWSS